MKKYLCTAGLLLALYSPSLAQITPPVTTGLKLNLDAATGFTGGATATWNDVSGSGNTVTATIPGTQPTWTASAAGTGLAGVLFDGIDDCLIRSAGSTTGMTAPRATLFVVRIGNTVANTTNYPALTNARTTLSIAQDRTFNQEFGLIGNWAIHHTSSGNWLHLDHPCYPTLNGGTPAVLTAVLNQPPTNSNIQYFVNGITSTNTPFPQGSPAAYPTFVSRTIAVGARYSSFIPGTMLPGSFFQGHILKVLAYDRVLTPAEVNTVNSYLLNRYRVQRSCNPCDPFTLYAANQVAYYNFSGGSTNDMTGNGHNGTAVGGAAPAPDYTGSPNCAYQFSGNPAQYIQIPSSPAFDLRSQPATISVWYKPLETLPGKYELLAGRGSGLNCPDKYGDYSLGLYDCRKPVGAINHTSNWDMHIMGMGWSCAQQTDYYVNAGWQHALVVFDTAPGSGTNTVPVRIYRNGVLSTLPGGMGTCGPATVNAGDFLIGADFKGSIDEVRIYNVAFSNADVATLYNYGIMGCCQTPPPPVPQSLKGSSVLPEEIMVYPNPFTRVINMSVPGRFTGGKVLVYNAVGQLVFSQAIKATQEELDLQKLPPGIYVIECVSGKERSRQKVTKL